MAESAARLHEPGSTAWQGAGFALLGLALGGLLIAAGNRVYALEGGVATLAGLGVWLALSGRGLGILAASQALGRVELRNSPGSQFLFGVGYAVCSLACTLPIFLVVAGSALAAHGVVGAAAQFVAYALGMG